MYQRESRRNSEYVKSHSRKRDVSSVYIKCMCYKSSTINYILHVMHLTLFDSFMEQDRHEKPLMDMDQVSKHCT